MSTGYRYRVVRRGCDCHLKRSGLVALVESDLVLRQFHSVRLDEARLANMQGLSTAFMQYK